jgi:DNA-binding MarR family transcriptional regulator
MEGQTVAHTIKIVPESKEARAILEAEMRHEAALEEATEQINRTLPRMFRNLKHQIRNTALVTAYKDMGEQQMGVLHELTRGKLLTSELAKKFDVANPTITRTVDRLVEMGYVEREPDPNDRRKIYLRLTEPGSRIGVLLETQFRAAMRKHLSRLTDGQLYDIALACRHLSTLFPEGMYEYDEACPVRPGAGRKE